MARGLQQHAQPSHVVALGNTCKPDGAVVIEVDVEAAVGFVARALAGGKAFPAERCKKSETLIVAAAQAQRLRRRSFEGIADDGVDQAAHARKVRMECLKRIAGEHENIPRALDLQAPQQDFERPDLIKGLAA